MSENFHHRWPKDESHDNQTELLYEWFLIGKVLTLPWPKAEWQSELILKVGSITNVSFLLSEQDIFASWLCRDGFQVFLGVGALWPCQPCVYLEAH